MENPTNKIISIDPSKCVACRNCEIACSLTKKGRYDTNATRIHVETSPESFLSFPSICIHCEEPECKQVCPSWAIYREERTGAILINSHRCIGCKMCLLACPFGCIRFDPEEYKALKCDLCNGEPECIHFCTTHALEFIEREEIVLSKIQKTFAKMMGSIKK